MPQIITPWTNRRVVSFGSTIAFGGFTPVRDATPNGNMAIAGWMQGESVAMGTMLPKLDWGKRGIYRDDDEAKSVPPALDQYDYMIPIPFIHIDPAFMIGMGVYREESEVQNYIHTLYMRGIGVGPEQMRLLDWANRLSQNWYGRTYTELNQTGVPDPMGDYVKRAQVRTAMATMSWTAWLAMQIATTKDMQVQNQAGTATAEITASVLGGVAGVVSQIAPPVGAIVAAVIGIVALIVSLVGLIISAGVTGRIASILRGIADSGMDVNPTDRATLCAVYTATKAVNIGMVSSAEEQQAIMAAAVVVDSAITENPTEAAILFENCPAFREGRPDLYATELTQDRIMRTAAEAQENRRIADAMRQSAEDDRLKAIADAKWEIEVRKRNKTLVRTTGIAGAVAAAATVAKILL